MSDLVLLSRAHMRRIEPLFPRSRGLDRRVVSGIIYVIRHGLQWKDAPRGYSPHKTLYNRFVRWSRPSTSRRLMVQRARCFPPAEDAPQGAVHGAPPHTCCIQTAELLAALRFIVRVLQRHRQFDMFACVLQSIKK
jgi:transposase